MYKEEIENFIKDLEELIIKEKKPLQIIKDNIIITIIITEKAEEHYLKKTKNEDGTIEIPIRVEEIKTIMENFPNPQEKLNELLQFKKEIKEKVILKMKSEKIKFKITGGTKNDNN